MSIYLIAFYCSFTTDVNMIKTYLTCFNSVLPSLSEVSLVGMMCISANEKVVTKSVRTEGTHSNENQRRSPQLTGKTLHKIKISPKQIKLNQSI